MFEDFYILCKSVETVFEREWRNAQEWEKEEKLAREKRAIMGWDEDCQYYIQRIKEIRSGEEDDLSQY